jgi:hypothetical protein
MGVSPMATGALTIDRIVESGKLESNIFAPGSWKRIQIIGDVPESEESREQKS